MNLLTKGPCPHPCGICSLNTILTVTAAIIAAPAASHGEGSIHGWGVRVVAGQEALTNLTAIAACGDHCLGVTSQGVIVVWESNDVDQCNVPAPNAGSWPSLQAVISTWD